MYPDLRKASGPAFGPSPSLSQTALLYDNDPMQSSDQPVFGFVLLGGPLSGALVRDIRLANELCDRGYKVHVWWAVDMQKEAPLRSAIQQRWLFHGFRYVSSNGSNIKDSGGRIFTKLFHDKNRARSAQKRPSILKNVMQGMINRVCNDVVGDKRIVNCFARELNVAGVTHLLPMLSILCPWAAAARDAGAKNVKYLVTFQGYELYVNFAQDNKTQQELFKHLIKTVADSNWPAIAVSEDYVDRVVEDIGVDKSDLRAIPPGVPAEVTADSSNAKEQISAKFPQYKTDLPLISYLGRRDTEKGIDLLLYAANIMRSQGVEFQLAICGPTLFGDQYSVICKQLAEDLRCPVMWSNHIPNELRTALFFASRCIVYPSIHREPFGMVPVEALAHGTPVIVPNYGGIASAIQAEGETGGLHFNVWDSSDLSDQITRIIKDDDLHSRLSEAGPKVASYYSVENLADRILAHLGLTSSPASESKSAVTNAIGTEGEFQPSQT